MIQTLHGCINKVRQVVSGGLAQAALNGMGDFYSGRQFVHPTCNNMIGIHRVKRRTHNATALADAFPVSACQTALAHFSPAPSLQFKTVISHPSFLTVILVQPGVAVYLISTMYK